MLDEIIDNGIGNRVRNIVWEWASVYIFFF